MPSLRSLPLGTRVAAVARLAAAGLASGPMLHRCSAMLGPERWEMVGASASPAPPASFAPAAVWTVRHPELFMTGTGAGLDPKEAAASYLAVVLDLERGAARRLALWAMSLKDGDPAKPAWVPEPPAWAKRSKGRDDADRAATTMLFVQGRTERVAKEALQLPWSDISELWADARRDHQGERVYARPGNEALRLADSMAWPNGPYSRAKCAEFLGRDAERTRRALRKAHEMWRKGHMAPS